MLRSLKWLQILTFLLFLLISIDCQQPRVRGKEQKRVGYLKTSYQREVRITNEDAERLVKEEIKIVIESDDEIPRYYQIPLDGSRGKTLINPAGLNATLLGDSSFVRGVIRDGLKFNDGTGGVGVLRGTSQVAECLFDVEYCREGFTIGHWIYLPYNLLAQYSSPIRLLSNSNFDPYTPGYSLILQPDRSLEFRVTKKSGDNWIANLANNLQLGRWYHILFTWDERAGISGFIDGTLSGNGARGQQIQTEGRGAKGEIIIGNVDVGGRRHDEKNAPEIIIDEIEIWTERKSIDDVPESGPIYFRHLTLDNLDREGGASYSGHPIKSIGKINGALKLDGRRDSITMAIPPGTCIVDIESCRYGVSLSGWVKIEKFSEGGFIFGSGPRGLRLYLGRDKSIVGEAQIGGKVWQVTWNKPAENIWYFVELSWSQDDGLYMYIDQKEIARTRVFKDVPSQMAETQISIGQNNRNQNYFAGEVDDFYVWNADRNILLKTNFIQRGKPNRFHLAMDEIDIDTIPHSNLSIKTYGRPRLISGFADSAIELDGRSQYIGISNQGSSCLGNLDLCRFGALLSMWVRLGTMKEDMDLFSTGDHGFQAWYTGGMIKILARTSIEEHTLQTPALLQNPDTWQFMEVSLDQKNGLQLYLDGQQIAQGTVQPRRSDISNADAGSFFLGKGDGSRSYAKYGNLSIDDVEYWYSNRDYLIAHGYIQRGHTERVYVDMNVISNNKVVHPSLDISAIGNPRSVTGRISNGIYMDGRSRQYLDLGYHGNKCLGNVELCVDGVTSSMWVKMGSFDDDSYLLSAGGMRIFASEGGKLNFVVDKGSQRWQTTAGNLRPNKWYFIEYTFHPDKGLRVYVDNRRVAMTNRFIDIRKPSLGTGRVLIGSANQNEAKDNSGRGKYLNATLDEFEMWYGDRDSLIGSRNILRDNITSILIPFEAQRGNKVPHPRLNEILLHNGASVVQNCKVGNCLLLEGSGEYVSLGDQSTSCMGSLAKCPHGFTIGMFLKPRSLPQNGYLLSAAPYSLYTKDGKLVARVVDGSREWLVSTNSLKTTDWQYVELSFHQSKGLQMFINRQLVASHDGPAHQTSKQSIQDTIVYVGRPNDDEVSMGGAYADAHIDELRYTFASRDQINLDDDINSIIIDMDAINRNMVVHSTEKIGITGGAKIVPAINATGVYLDGSNQYLMAQDSDLLCYGDLDNCPEGFTMRFKLKPSAVQDDAYLFSSNNIDVRFLNRRIVTDIRKDNRMWRLTSHLLKPENWYQVDISWSPVDAATLHVNSERADRTEGRSVAVIGGGLNQNAEKKFYIGRANTDMKKEHYVNAAYDDVQLWDARRDVLLSRNLIFPETIPISTTVAPSTTPYPTQTPYTFPPFTFPSRRTLSPISTFTRSTGIFYMPGFMPGSGRRLYFDGSNWIRYDMSRLPQDYYNKNKVERINLKLQTTQKDALIYFNGDDQNNVALYLKDGRLYLVTTVDGRKQDIRISPMQINDGNWHDIFITKTGRQVQINIDSLSYDHRLNTDNVTFLRPSNVYFGGTEDVNIKNQYHIDSNFEGRIREFLISGSQLPSDIDYKGLYLIRPSISIIDNSIRRVVDESDDPGLSLLRPNPVLIDISSDSEKIPPPTSDVPITFTTGRSFIYLPGWPQGASPLSERSLRLTFKTFDPNGVLLYTAGDKDFIAVELYDGMPYLVVDFGDGVRRLPFGNGPPFKTVNDGRPHSLNAIFTQRNIRLELDDDENTHPFISGSQRTLDLGSPGSPQGIVYLGGVHPTAHIPWHSWNAGVEGANNRKNFRGCIWDVRFNSAAEAVDLARLVKEQKVVDVEPQCRTMVDHCERNQCRNGGICLNKFDGYECDCASTKFTDTNCRTEAPIVSFGGQERIEINYSPPISTHVNDVSLRFKTPNPNGLLYVLSNPHTRDFIKVYLEDGVGKIESNLGGLSTPSVISILCNEQLSDNEWHTILLKRRANSIAASIDECPSSTVDLPGSDYYFDISRVRLGIDKDDPSATSTFIGHLQNFKIDSQFPFNHLPPNSGGNGFKIISDVDASKSETLLPIHPVTFRANSNAYLSLPSLQIIGDTGVRIMFKTEKDDGLILYNKGVGSDFFAVELVDGVLNIIMDDGNGPKIISSKGPKLSDGKWHSLDIQQKSNSRFEVIIDDRQKEDLLLSSGTRHTLDLMDLLYVGGVPDTLKPRLSPVMKSRGRGFSGCLATMFINKYMYNLLRDSINTSPFVTSGCTDSIGFCSGPGQSVCKHGGVCLETLTGFICDCNMTSFIGRTCTEEAEGWRYSEQDDRGISVFTIRDPIPSTSDYIAFGLMTWATNGTLVKVDSNIAKDFFEAKLEDGYVAVNYDLGDGKQEIIENRRRVNDGRYHYVVFTRHGNNATLRVDDFPDRTIMLPVSSGGDQTFNEMSMVKVGGDLDSRNNIINYFNGIVSGVYINGHRAVDLGVIHHDTRVKTRGDVTVASHPFFVPKPLPRTPKPPEIIYPIDPPIEKPPIVYPPVEKPIVPPKEIPGGGLGWEPGSNIGVVDGGVPNAEPIVGMKAEPLIGAGSGEGARAATAVGSVIGLLLLGSSLLWALYKCKPGLLGLGGPKSSLKISGPTSTAPLLSSAAGMGTNGAPPPGGKPADLSNYFPPMGTNPDGSGTGTMHQGIQTGEGETLLQKNIFHTQQSAVGGGGFEHNIHGAEFGLMQGTPTGGYYGQNIYDAGQYGTGFAGYTHEANQSYSATMRTGYDASEHMFQQSLLDQRSPLELGYGAQGTGGGLNLMAAEEIRVDCVQMTANGRYVITGSTHGPPQIWDMKTGELVKVMKGDDLSSTDLHLANGDSLLIGQVAELEPVDPASLSSHSPTQPHRKLQIWDFGTGHALEMRVQEHCTAICMVGTDRVALGRTEKFGGGTTVVVWDILGNEPVRRLHCGTSVGFADHVSKIFASKDGRYVIAGFQNSYDNMANFVTFDLSSPDSDVKVTSYDAKVEVTVVTVNNEMITGTRDGRLVVWNLKSGKEVRQLIAPGSNSAHRGEIKDLILSPDASMLVSASADRTIKIWSIPSEKLVQTLSGHTDEVWCAHISPDNTMVASGSRDCTIRLWRISDGQQIAAIDTGMSIMKILLSNNKNTIVALGDRGHDSPRKLIMLKVARSTKTIDNRRAYVA